MLDMNGVKVAVIGTVTQEVPSLVTPAGIADLEFGDPVEAINRVAAKIKAAKLADVIIVENHDGAGSGTPEGATLAQEVAAGGPFAKMVTEVTPDVAAIFNGHTHKQYAWDAPVPGVRGQDPPDRPDRQLRRVHRPDPADHRHQDHVGHRLQGRQRQAHHLG